MKSIIGRVKFGVHAPNTIHHFVYILYFRWYDGYDKKKEKIKWLKDKLSECDNVVGT